MFGKKESTTRPGLLVPLGAVVFGFLRTIATPAMG